MNRRKVSGRVLLPALVIIFGIFALAYILEEWVDVGKGLPVFLLGALICALVVSVVWFLIERVRRIEPKDEQGNE